LEKIIRELLQAREEEWRQKSQALWLHSGDEKYKIIPILCKRKENEKHYLGNQRSLRKITILL
jgi:hypothetical protein